MATTTTTPEIGRQDFTIRQGSTWIRNITWETGSPATPVDITGYTARMHIRATLTSTSTIIELTTANGRITLTNPTLGIMQLKVAATDTAALDFTQGVYDLELESPAGEVTAILEGIVYLSKEVTR